MRVIYCQSNSKNSGL